MNWTADFLIERRRARWEEDRDLERDRVFREVVARELVTDGELRAQVAERPERFIELLMVIVDKDKHTVPFFLNEVQRDFIGRLNRAKEDFASGRISRIALAVLKGRQQGFTSLITAYQLASILLSRNFEGFTVTDKTSNSEAIFDQKAKYPYTMLPEIVKPTEKYNNKRQITFSKLNSTWSVETATKQLGRSRTINFLHCSEGAFWPYGISATQASLGPALTKNCIEVQESTANGLNDFYTLWTGGQYVRCFYEWWRTPEYAEGFPDERERREFLAGIDDPGGGWLKARLRWLRGEKHLTPEQLHRYAKKYEGYLEKELIKQEYPCTPEEAFIASGTCVFDVEAVMRRLDAVRARPPLRRGRFEFDTTYDADRDRVEIVDGSVRWVDDPAGYVYIYEDARPGVPYVVGGDTAGEGSDLFVGQVLDNTTGRQVAKLRHQFDEDVFTGQIYCLGIHYNRALVGVEANFSSYPIKKLQEYGYPNQYVRQAEDTYTHGYKPSYGFRTTPVTRPVIIAELVRIVRESVDLLNDPDTLKEMLTFIKNERGRPEAQQGEHDDHVMALAIAYYIRPQQSFRAAVPEAPRVQWTPDLWEDYRSADEAGRKYLVAKYGNPF